MKESQFRRMRAILKANRDLSESYGDIYEWGGEVFGELAELADEMEEAGREMIERAKRLRTVADRRAYDLGVRRLLDEDQK